MRAGECLALNNVIARFTFSIRAASGAHCALRFSKTSIIAVIVAIVGV